MLLFFHYQSLIRLHVIITKAMQKAMSKQKTDFSAQGVTIVLSLSQRSFNIDEDVA